MLFSSESTCWLSVNLNSGKPSLCADDCSHPNLVEVAGLAGFDCFMADMMFAAHDRDRSINRARRLGVSQVLVAAV